MTKTDSRRRRCFPLVLLCALALMPTRVAESADTPKSGGILRAYHRDSPGGPSILEETSNSVTVPFMAVFNNLVLYKQDEPRNSVETIEPELATGWHWNADNTALTFQLREGVRWHDGKPFTSHDVKCTWDLLRGKSATPLRNNPRLGWYHNLNDVSTDGDFAVTFHLGRPQPAMLALLASGYSAVYPCHVPPRDMRQHPIGTGPFKFVEFRQNQSITLTRNTDYWKLGLPYLDGVEYTIITNRSTALLGFTSGKFDMTFPNEVSIPLLKDMQAQAPHAICKLTPNNCAVNAIVNRERPPFDNPDIRLALTLAIDRQGFIDILSEGQSVTGGSMQPPPEGVWGMPEPMLRDLPGYGKDVEQNRAKARALMEKHGYGPNNRLKIKVSARNIPTHRDPGILLVDTLKHIYIDAELEPVDTASWFPKIARKDYTLGPNITCGAVDDPDQNFYENYACGSARNFTQYCNKDLEPLFDQQSRETDFEKRRAMVWEIDRRLQEDIARPIIYHVNAATCWQPYLKGFTPMVNSVYNFPRLEKVWLDR
jgi:peptide/nickel transport system substrate-binding protein